MSHLVGVGQPVYEGGLAQAALAASSISRPLVKYIYIAGVGREAMEAFSFVRVNLHTFAE